jgi:hypothetical protein
LSASSRQKVIAGDHPGRDENRVFWTVSLANEILIRRNISGRNRKIADFCNVVIREARVLLQVTY